MGLWNRQVGRYLLMLVLCAGPMVGMADMHMARNLPETGTLDLSREPQVLVPRDSVTISDVATGRLDAELVHPTRALVDFSGDNELWVRLRLRNGTKRAFDWHLDCLLPGIDEVAVFKLQGGTWTEQVEGDRVAQSRWPHPGRFPRFRLDDFDPGQEQVLFVRARNAYPAPVPLRVITEVAGDTQEQITSVGLGLVLGALLLLAGACLVQALLYRDAVYFLYAIYSALLGLSFASATGLAGQLAWAESPRWNEMSKTVFPLLAAGVSVWLARAMCRLNARKGRLSRYALLTGAVTVVLAFGSALPESFAFWLLGAGILLATSMVAAIALSTWQRGEPIGAWVLASHSPLFIVSILILSRVLRLAIFDVDVTALLSVSLAATLPLMLLGLYLQSKQLLAVRVRMREMATTDALTGLLTASLFERRVRAAVTRWRKSRHNAAVLYVRLVNAGWIREAYGGATLEQSLIRAAIKLQQSIPDADCVGRVREETMGLILETSTSRQEIMERAARLIAHGLMPLAGLKPKVTLQFHVAVGVLADSAMDGSQLQAALAATLNSMSPRTHRPIRFLDPGIAIPAPGVRENDTGLGTLAA